MVEAVPMAEVWRGDFLESVHAGHAVIADASGGIVRSWGESELTILPRSATKPIQALPLVESGVALSDERVALACASHQGAALHVRHVAAWLDDLGLGPDDLLCGPETPRDPEEARRLAQSGERPSPVHDNCSGKHTGFLMLGQRLGGGPAYCAPDHPVQQAVLAALEDATGVASPGHATDGCSAPNFATTLRGLATAMARFAAAPGRSGARDRSMARIVAAMRAHPDLVAGEGRACTEFMRAMDGTVLKTGAEGVFVAILPAPRLGVALKIADGATRASEAAIAAILVLMGALDPGHPAARRRLRAPILTRRGAPAAEVRPAPELTAGA
jgi:L-asparaginase II